MAKNPFNFKRPKITVQTVELGPHHRKVFTLPKEESTQNFKPGIWIVACFIVGFFVCATVIESAYKSVVLTKALFAKSDTIAYEPVTPTSSEVLGSDEVVPKEKPITGEYYLINPDSTPSWMSSLSYLVGDVDTGQILYEKSPELVLPIASVSKLMTAIVAKDALDLHERVTVTRSSIDTYGTAGGLLTGESILITDLMYPLLIESSNDAAEVLATGLGRADFLRKMNEKARSLGMNDTFYNDPSGLSYQNVSSVHDLFALARHIDRDYLDIWDVTRVREYGILKHKWQNGNNQLKKTSFIGGKNGFTDEALRTTVSLFEVPLKVKDSTDKQKKRIAIVILKSNDRDGDVDRLLRYIENNIGFEPIVTEQEEVASSTPEN